MKKILCWLKVVLCLKLFFALVFIIYGIKFSDSSIVQIIQILGAFGGSIVDLISAIIDIVSLLQLEKKTVFVEKLNNHRHLNEFRYNALTELYNKYDSLNYSANSLKAFKHQIDNFYNRNLFLFKNMEEQLTMHIKRLSEKLSSEIIIVKAYEARVKMRDVYIIDDEEFMEFSNLNIKLKEPMKDIKYLFDDLIALLQKQIVSAH